MSADTPWMIEAHGLTKRYGEALAVHNLDLQVRAGEILGIAGVSGNGQQELLAALSGEDRRARPAAVLLAGEPVGTLGPGQRRKRGLHFIPEERLGRATVPVLSLVGAVVVADLAAADEWSAETTEGRPALLTHSL